MSRQPASRLAGQVTTNQQTRARSASAYPPTRNVTMCYCRRVSNVDGSFRSRCITRPTAKKKRISSQDSYKNKSCCPPFSRAHKLTTAQVPNDIYNILNNNFVLVVLLLYMLLLPQKVYCTAIRGTYLVLQCPHQNPMYTAAEAL